MALEEPTAAEREPRSCDLACPGRETEEAIRYQNYGCLPEPYEINRMLAEGKVWMCHSDPTRPCAATGLTQVPEGMTPVTAY